MKFRQLLVISSIFMGANLVLSGCTNDFVINNKTTMQETTEKTGQNSDVISAMVDQEFSLHVGQEAKIQNTDLSVYFLDLQSDSRCPSDVTCIAKGTAAIEINVFQNGTALTKNVIYLNEGRNEYLNENYDVEFIKIDPVRGKKSNEIPKSDYVATLKLKNTALAIPVTELKDPDGVIFPKGSLSYLPAPTEFNELWTPSVEDVKKAETLAKTCIVEKKNSAADSESKASTPRLKSDVTNLEAIEKKFPLYLRQYVGFIQKQSGHKLIWINLFEKDEFLMRQWKKNIIMVDDGGYSFFNVLVDLEDNSCLKFAVNGNA